MLPEGAHYWATLLVVLLLGNIIYVGLVTIAQNRLDWMLGYSSVMHMGYIFLGIASFNVLGITGAVVLMFAHGLSIALLFGLAGELRRRTGTLAFDELGGLAKVMPLAGLAFGLGVVRCNRSSRLCEFCRRNHDFFRRVQEWLGNRTNSHVPNRHNSCSLGRGDLDGVHVASLPQDVHGHDSRAMAATARSWPGITCADHIACHCASLLWILSAIVGANRGAEIQHLSSGEHKTGCRDEELSPWRCAPSPRANYVPNDKPHPSSRKPQRTRHGRGCSIR